jgi:hypothetical protein
MRARIGFGDGLCKRVHPEVSAAGLDPDPKALARAKRRQRELRALIEDYGKGAVRPVVIPEISDQNRT